MGNSLLAMTAAAAIGAAAATATAQAERSPLAGPEVEATDVPGVESRYVAGDPGGVAVREISIPLPVFFEELRGLGGGEIEDAARLSEDQAARIRAEARAFAGEVGEYLEAVGPEVEALLAQLPQAERRRATREMAAVERLTRVLGAMVDERRGGAAGEGRGDAAVERERFRLDLRSAPPPPADAGAMGPMHGMGEEGGSAELAVERLREIRDASPQAGDLQARVWELLSERQRALLVARFEGYQREVRERREEQRMERMLAQRRQDAPLAPQPDRAPRGSELADAAIERIVGSFRAGEFPEPLWSRLPENARRRLEGLTPEERASAVERLLKRRAGGAGAATSPARGRTGG